MPPTAPDPAIKSRPSHLGRVLALGFAALFLMVGMGVYWVWQRAHREQAWRDEVNAREPIIPVTAPGTSSPPANSR